MEEGKGGEKRRAGGGAVLLPGKRGGEERFGVFLVAERRAADSGSGDGRTQELLVVTVVEVVEKGEKGRGSDANGRKVIKFRIRERGVK